VVTVVTQKQGTLLAKNAKGAVKEVLGSCVSMGVTVDGKEPKAVQQEIDAGGYDEFLKDHFNS
jgi:large subunit ribosomal protein L11